VKLALQGASHQTLPGPEYSSGFEYSNSVWRHQSALPRDTQDLLAPFPRNPSPPDTPRLLEPLIRLALLLHRRPAGRRRRQPVGPRAMEGRIHRGIGRARHGRSHHRAWWGRRRWAAGRWWRHPVWHVREGCCARPIQSGPSRGSGGYGAIVVRRGGEGRGREGAGEKEEEGSMVPVVDLPTIPAPPCCKGCAGPAHAAIHSQT
jgi:hypothetical protein